MSDTASPESSSAPSVSPDKKGANKPPVKPALKSAPRVWFKDPVTGEQKLRDKED